MAEKNKTIFFLFLALVLFSAQAQAAASFGAEDATNVTLVLFYSSTCPHCHEEREWLNTSIKPRYPMLVIEEYEVSEYRDLYEEYCAKYNTSTSGVPRTFVNGKVFIGFTNSEGELVYSPGLRGYVGYASQIEKAIQECLKESCSVVGDKVIEISMKDPLVVALLEKSPKSVSTTLYLNDTYLVAWWSPERLASKEMYPDVLVAIDSATGGILSSTEPSGPVEGVNKPVQLVSWLNLVMAALIAAYLLAYLLLNRMLKLDQRFWLAGFIALLVVEFFIYFTTTPVGVIERFASGFPFPVFVFIIALADGFNPCAFTVLIVLLSLLTHTKSRKKMLLVGGLFILTSAFMYFVFIMAINFIGSWVFAQYGTALFMLLGAIVLVAGLINLKDYFFFKKGLSLTISDSNRDKIFKKAGKIVKKVNDAGDRRALFAALLGTVLLAVLVNLVELGCTAMLPMAYMAALMQIYGTSLNAYHIAYTAFYSLVYVLPLFVILGNFAYTFKSERLSEKSARILKLVGGAMMTIFGLVMILKPDLLLLLR